MNAVIDLATRREPTTPAPLKIAPGDRILRMATVKERVGLSASTIYRRIASNDFPAQVPLGGTVVGWRESAINEWIASRGQIGAM